jgi:hypothetical protein
MCESDSHGVERVDRCGSSETGEETLPRSRQDAGAPRGTHVVGAVGLVYSPDWWLDGRRGGPHLGRNRGI